MKTLFIPPLGTNLILAEDWTFELHNEYRNESLMELVGDKRQAYYGWSNYVTPTQVTLPAGTPLKTDRIYIRKGNEAYDSITFTIPKSRPWEALDNFFGPGFKKPKGQVRFWVKLADANNAVIEELPAD